MSIIFEANISLLANNQYIKLEFLRKSWLLNIKISNLFIVYLDLISGLYLIIIILI